MQPSERRIQCPPGLTPWGMGASSTKDPTQWTGIYVVTILATGSKLETVSKVLPPGFKVDPNLVKNGEYPVLLLFGCILDAANRIHPFLGLNYLEVFSAIPGVYIDSPDLNLGFSGPYVYPYRGYLNHLIPCILGWFASYPKSLKWIKHTRHSSEENQDSFTVGPLFGSKPLVKAEFESDWEFQRLAAFRPNIDAIINLVSPNVIHKNLFGKGFVRSAFDLAFVETAVAWNMPNVGADIFDDDLFPGLSGTPHLWKGLQNQEYGAARFVLAWRLIPQQSKEFQPAPWPPPLWQPASSASA